MNGLQAFVFGVPALIVGTAVVGLIAYPPMLYAVPGLCLGLIGWTQVVVMLWSDWWGSA